MALPPKSKSDKVLAGVVGGLAKDWDMDATLLRILFVVLVLVTGGIGLLLYLVLALIMD